MWTTFNEWKIIQWYMHVYHTVVHVLNRREFLMQGILFTVIFNDAEIVKHAINNTLYEVIKMVLLF